jgi:ABC-2 type transport system permease protein
MLGWVLAACAFWTTRIQAIMQLYDRFSFVFSGQIAPLGLLPGGLRTLGAVLPFGSMLWAPAEILRGGADVSQAATLIGIQALWLLLSCLAFVGVWRLGLRQYGAVGA